MVLYSGVSSEALSLLDSFELCYLLAPDMFAFLQTLFKVNVSIFSPFSMCCLRCVFWVNNVSFNGTIVKPLMSRLQTYFWFSSLSLNLSLDLGKGILTPALKLSDPLDLSAFTSSLSSLWWNWWPLAFFQQGSVMINCQAPRKPYRVSQMTTIFITLLCFPSFLGASVCVTYTMWRYSCTHTRLFLSLRRL